MREKCRFIAVCTMLMLTGVTQGESLGIGIYFGHLHNHSSFSDGDAPPVVAYSTARSNGLDFFGLADHGKALTPEEFEQMKVEANDADTPGVFSTFWGFEWSHDYYGHIAVINPDTYASSTSDATDTFREFMAWLDGNASVAFFNHPGRQDDSTYQPEFEHFTGAYSGSIVGMELWNKTAGFSVYYDNGGYTSDGRDRSGYYDEALANGWFIGAAGSEDHHDTNWGGGSYRLAIIAGSNTREALLTALGERCFYSTLDENLELSFTVNGEQMGSSVTGGWTQCVIEAADRDNETFSRVEVIHNGMVVSTQSVAGQIHPVVTFELFTQQGDHLYCKVTQSDGGEAISSPVFITSDGLDGSPRADVAVPLDNGPDDFEPADDYVTVNTAQSNFQIQLTDFDGIDETTVAAATVSINGVTVNDTYFSYDQTNSVITLLPPGGSAFGNGVYTIVLSGGAARICDSLGTPMDATTLTVEIDMTIVAPLHFQSSVDTMIHGAYPANSYAGSSVITADSYDAGKPSHVLLRFDDIIGGSSGQIPWGATITSATLRLRSLDSGNGGSLHAMLQPWSDTSTWGTLLGGDGIQANDTEAASSADASISSNSASFVELDVTATVQDWASGTLPNYGWVVLPNGTDGWDIASAEHTTADYPPELVVEFTGGVPIYVAHSPSPHDGASGVPLNAQLQWAPGMGAVAHDVYLWTGSTPVLVSPRQAGTTYTPGQLLAGNTTYSWRIDEYYTTESGETPATGDVWTFTTGPEAIVSKAVGESAVKGTLDGSRVDTEFSDNAYQRITEVLSVPNKNGYSTLEHIWRFDVPAGTYVEFSVEASRSAGTDGDNFDFSYSTDGTTYHYMLTVTSTTDTVQSFALPSNTAGTVYVKATDTDHTKGSTPLDTLSVDFMCIVSSQVPIVTYNYKATNPTPSDGAAGVQVDTLLSWTAGDQAVTHNVYLGTSPDNLPLQASTPATSYSPTESLAEGTVYYWRVDEVRLDDQVETGDVWSFTTYAAPGTPTSLTVSVTTTLVKVNPPNDSGMATVTVVDNLGRPVEGAEVTAMFIVDFTADAPETKSTDANGQAVFMRTFDYKKPTFDFQVISVMSGSLTWPQ